MGQSHCPMLGARPKLSVISEKNGSSHWRFGSRLVYAEVDGIPLGIPNPNQNEIINGFIGLFSIFDSLPATIISRACSDVSPFYLCETPASPYTVPIRLHFAACTSCFVVPSARGAAWAWPQRRNHDAP